MPNLNCVLVDYTNVAMQYPVVCPLFPVKMSPIIMILLVHRGIRRTRATSLQKDALAMLL